MAGRKYVFCSGPIFYFILCFCTVLFMAGKKDLLLVNSLPINRCDKKLILNCAVGLSCQTFLPFIKLSHSYTHRIDPNGCHYLHLCRFRKPPHLWMCDRRTWQPFNQSLIWPVSYTTLPGHITHHFLCTRQAIS